MFTSARLKLTAWYLLIIMGISISFSIVIYQVLNREVERFARGQRLRMERFYRDSVIGRIIPSPDRSDVFPPQFDPDLLAEASSHIIQMLIIVDGVIFIVSGCLGYILAGQTLRPIKLMVDEQNRFISDSSHELRTPLTALKSTMEVNLRDKKLTLAQARTVMKESIDEVNKLQFLSDALLQLAQYDTKTTRMPVSEVSLQELVMEAIKKIHPIATEKRIRIHTDMQPATIMGDQYSLTELLVILLDNAIKFSKPSAIVEILTEKNAGNIQIRIKDHGMGIAQKDIDHIFDRFFRADEARTKNTTPGYGLGLSIAKKIVQSHNGTITVESEPDKETVFTIRLPASFS